MLAAERQHILDRARDALLRALPEAWAAYAYGSIVRGDERADSDLDVAVLLPPGAHVPDTLSLLAQLSRAVGRDVDVADLRCASGDLIHQVLREGRELFARDATLVLGWEAEQMSDYADFNPRRSGILEVYLSAPLRAHRP